MAIIVRGFDVPKNCAQCDVHCDERRLLKRERPDKCPIIAMPDECLECVMTKFRAAIKCGEWAKMNTALNKHEHNDSIACPFYHLFMEQVENTADPQA